jgi:hypothetical protein
VIVAAVVLDEDHVTSPFKVCFEPSE